MTTAKRLLTGEDLLRLPDDGGRYELVDGELIELPVVRSMYRVLAIAERTTSR